MDNTFHSQPLLQTPLAADRVLRQGMDYSLYFSEGGPTHGAQGMQFVLTVLAWTSQQ